MGSPFLSTIKVDPKSFQIKDLLHPGEWIENQKIAQILLRAANFQLTFTSKDKSAPKSGVLALNFDSESLAREVYEELRDATVDGRKLAFNVHHSFLTPPTISIPSSSSAVSAQFFPPPGEDETAVTIYAINLPGSTERDLIESIVGPEVIKSVNLLPLNDGKQAEIVLTSSEAATTALEDYNDFELNDGNQSGVMKLFTAEKYREFVEQESAKKPDVAPEKAAKVGENGTVTVEKENKQPAEIKRSEAGKDVSFAQTMAPEIDEDQIYDSLMQHVETTRLNWAELNDLHELYAVCDEVSAAYDGLPDSLLKPAMLRCLQSHLREHQSDWMRRHLETLIQLWKREVVSETVFKRDTLVAMAAPVYDPLPLSNTRKRKMEKGSASTRAGRVQMAVADILNNCRQTMRVEEGEIDVDENADGQILLDGEVLSFDSWARMTKTKKDGVVSTVQNQLEAKENKKAIKKQQRKTKEYKEKQMSAKKMKIMQQSRTELEQMETEKNGDDAEGTTPKETEDGEIDSGEEGRKKQKAGQKKKEKKKKNSSDSSSSSSSNSSSSSSSESEGEPSDARGRRRRRRKQDRRNGPGPILHPRIQQMYELRHQIVAHLPPVHKTAYATVLNQIRSNAGRAISHTQLNEMNRIMSTGGF